MLQISSDWRDWSMKWLSIFATGAHRHFSGCECGQTNSSRGEFNAAAQCSFGHVARGGVVVDNASMAGRSR
jgi:hypothetical protein